MRHWRGALDQIYDHNANKVPPTYTPRSDTEKALIDALKELELQCKERIDLLEALRASRHDSPSLKAGGKLSKVPEGYDSSKRPKGSIGQGTIPAVSYAELSRPSLPQRPPLPARPATESAAASSNSSNHTPWPKPQPPHIPPPIPLSKPASPSRSQSPDKYTMRTTLRSGRPGDKQPRTSRKSPRPTSEGPSKAATLAWSALNSRERTGKGVPTSPDAPSAPQMVSQRHSSEHPRKLSSQLLWDSHSRRLVPSHDPEAPFNGGDSPRVLRHSDEYSGPSTLSVSAASSALTSSQDPPPSVSQAPSPVTGNLERHSSPRTVQSATSSTKVPRSHPQYDRPTTRESLDRQEKRPVSERLLKGRDVPKQSDQGPRSSRPVQEKSNTSRTAEPRTPTHAASSSDDDFGKSYQRSSQRAKGTTVTDESTADDTSDESQHDGGPSEESAWKKRKEALLKSLPPGVEEAAAKQILNDIVVQGDEVRWSDIAGLDVAKNALREAVVYPFLRPDLFMGLREPARGMLLFGPPGTGKTMLARAVATESRSTFFSISASSLTSKFLGESEKLVRALFALAKVLAPSIIFVDEIDSLLSQRSGSGEHEATRRIKTEFLIQWSDLQRAAAGRETTEKDKERGDANRVLVLAATNLPWAIDEAARRRFVRRQYIPLPEPSTRETQLRTLLGQQKHNLSGHDIDRLVDLSEGEGPHL